MRKWGIVISVFYALILLGLLLPAFLLLAEEKYYDLPQFFKDIGQFIDSWELWTTFGVLLSGQILLLILSVDTSQKRLKPRSHILISCAVAAILTALISCTVIWSIGVAFRGDKFKVSFTGSEFDLLIWLGVLWLVWGILFYIYFRNSSAVVTRLLSWLLKGSILELLVAVPCHVIVRRRHDCSAPMVTSFGIVTGIAIMILSFGPSVLFLYKKRLDAYRSGSSA
ncbi:MAG TPA: hypothetical protein VE263_08540 [Candidatus Angelobacter sp.]|nr:hypothetical protein [Candidatus Angelobacter sp.]